MKISSINAGNSNYIRPKELEKRDKIQEFWENHERGEIDQAQYTDKMSKYYRFKKYNL